MNKLTSFELQTYRAGTWKIDSIYDDRDLALFEAKRLAESRRHSGVRVVQEDFDEQTSETSTRVLYRSNMASDANTQVIEKRKEVRRDANQARTKKKPDIELRPGKRPQGEDSTFSLGIILTGGSILLFGIAAMLALRYVATML